ncbi:hypothetical protein [Nonomuraea sp. NPDC050202]|uniref:hypothetical protein n=1 Tax=Nonomuraea sp. NPDC050202 TaxID=3155035 RepID=UPI0033DA6741
MVDQKVDTIWTVNRSINAVKIARVKAMIASVGTVMCPSLDTIGADLRQAEERRGRWSFRASR